MTYKIIIDIIMIIITYNNYHYRGPTAGAAGVARLRITLILY